MSGHSDNYAEWENWCQRSYEEAQCSRIGRSYAEATIIEMPFEYCSGKFSKTPMVVLYRKKIFKDPINDVWNKPVDVRKKVLILGAGQYADTVEYLSRKI